MRSQIAVWGYSVALALSPGLARAQHRAHLTSSEREKLRDAQNPSKRIEVYLSLAQQKLDQAQQPGRAPGSARLLNDYISITDEMKHWIQYQYDHRGDMRAGLKNLVEQGPQQIEQLRHLQASTPASARNVRRALREAIADMTDGVDGGAKALSDQEKVFGKLKQERKLEAREIKARRKEAEKEQKRERKLLKRLRKKHPTGEPNGNGDPGDT